MKTNSTTTQNTAAPAHGSEPYGREKSSSSIRANGNKGYRWEVYGAAGQAFDAMDEAVNFAESTGICRYASGVRVSAFSEAPLDLEHDQTTGRWENEAAYCVAI